MTDEPKPAEKNWHLRIDVRDLLGVSGVALVLVGAATIHWGLALAVVGAGLFVLAFRLSR
jgi:hypothetical protein